MNQEANEKLIAIVEKKLSSEQNILSIIVTIYFFPVKNPNNKKVEDSLIISTNNLYFIQGTQIKKIMPIKHINYITLAILGQQIIIHCDKEWIRIQSSQIIDILGNILLAKEKFLNDKGSFTIHLEIQRTLESFTDSDYHKRSIFSIFKKNDKKMLTASGRRISFCTIDVNEKNFILEIGKKCYKAIFQNAELLHISGEATGFRFDAQNYQYRDLSKDDTLYWKEGEQGKRKQYLRRKISKNSLFEIELIRRNLSNYKLNDYNQNIIYALQLDTHFQVITQVFDNWIYCWEYLIHHNNYERSLANGRETLSQESLLTQVELRSIFYKLHTFVEEESQKNNILSSLSLDHIYISNGDATISTVFCKILSKVNVSYIAPEQFKSLQKRLSKDSEIKSKTFSTNQNHKSSFQEAHHIQGYRTTEHESKTVEGQLFSSFEIYKVNLWKLGMLLYELAYLKLPFPIEYVAYKVKQHEHIKVHFPQRDNHSIEFHHFLKSLICKDPIIRGMRTKGDVRMSILNPQITCIMSHEWITKGKI